MERDASDDSGRRLRSDAERNRERILCAARGIYRKGGLGASMACIARSAGVGIATLFRRFPTRADLVAAVFADAMEENRAAAAAALEDPDAWNGFRRYIEALCALQVRNRGFAEVLTMNFPAAKELEDTRRNAYKAFAELVDRAKAQGRLRADFTPEDLLILLMANAGVLGATSNEAELASKRLVAHLLRAFAVDGEGALPPSPEPKALLRAMVRQRRSAEQ